MIYNYEDSEKPEIFYEVWTWINKLTEDFKHLQQIENDSHSDYKEKFAKIYALEIEINSDLENLSVVFSDLENSDWKIK